MTEVQAILATGCGFMLINIAGWYLSHMANSRRQARNEGVKSERLTQIEKRVDDLPCEAIPAYGVQHGQLLQKVEDIQLRVTRIEQQFNHRSEDITKRLTVLESKANSTG